MWVLREECRRARRSARGDGGSVFSVGSPESRLCLVICTVCRRYRVCLGARGRPAWQPRAERATATGKKKQGGSERERERESERERARESVGGWRETRW